MNMNPDPFFIPRIDIHQLNIVFILVLDRFWIHFGLVLDWFWKRFNTHLFPIYMPYIYIDIWHINGE